MNQDQKKNFEVLYKFAHDEAINCSNLIGMIDINFPDAEADEISQALHHYIKPYLTARADLGGKAMELLYWMAGVIDENTGG